MHNQSCQCAKTENTPIDFYHFKHLDPVCDAARLTAVSVRAQRHVAVVYYEAQV